MAVDSQDRVLLLTRVQNATRPVYVFRFAGHELDSSWGADGVAELSFGTPEEDVSGPAHIVVTPKGVVADASVDVIRPPSGEPYRDYRLSRLDDSGVVDPLFGDQGVASHRLNHSQQPLSGHLLATPDGRLTNVMPALGGVDLLRLLPTGALDESFSGDGRARIDGTIAGRFLGGFNYAALRPDGGVAVAVWPMVPDSFAGAAIVSFTAAGERDSTFGDNGVALLPDETRRSPGPLAVDALGRVVASTMTSNLCGSMSVLLVRLNLDGTPDWTFGAGGFGLAQGALVIDGACGPPSAVIARADGRYQVVGTASAAPWESDIHIVQLLPDVPQTPSGFRVMPWHPASGLTSHGVAVTATGDGGLASAARGLDGAVWHQGYDGGWSGWESLGGQTTDGPAITSDPNGNQTVFARGLDGAIWWKQHTGTWSGWMSLGGFAKGAPAATTTPAGDLEVFARGGDDGLWHRTSTNGVWSDWTPLGGLLTAPPAVTSDATDNRHVAAQGRDGALWARSRLAGSWQPWRRIGGQLRGHPAIVASPDGALDVFARGLDDQLWHIRVLANSWGTFEPLGGALSSPPAAAIEPDLSNPTIEVMGRGQDGQPWDTQLVPPNTP